jgi:hypothetical protein
MATLSNLLGSNFQGNSGFSGFSGLGLSGFSGTSGFSGQVGTSGFSGISGYSGETQTSIPQSTNTTIVSSDAGKHINATAGVTINSSTGFSVGDAVTIYNNSAENITITATGITLYFAGTSSTGNRTLAQRGLTNVLCVASNTYVIGGPGLS